jgi:hypothetical protein
LIANFSSSIDRLCEDARSILITTKNAVEKKEINELVEHIEALKHHNYNDSAISAFCSAVFDMILAKNS